MAHVYGNQLHMALVMRALAAQAARDLPTAAVWLRTALDILMDGDNNAQQHAAWHSVLTDIIKMLPTDAAATLEREGPMGLRKQIQESSLPPCLRPPKEQFAHYKQWMRERLVRLLGPAQATPAVLEGLLGLDAVDLDLLLQAAENHGDDRALQQRVDALHAAPAVPVLELSWDEVRVLRRENTPLLTDA